MHSWEGKDTLILLKIYNTLPNILMYVISFLYNYNQAHIILMKNTNGKTSKAIWSLQKWLLILHAPSIWMFIWDLSFTYYLIYKFKDADHFSCYLIFTFEALMIHVARKKNTGKNEIKNARTTEWALDYKSLWKVNIN